MRKMKEESAALLNKAIAALAELGLSIEDAYSLSLADEMAQVSENLEEEDINLVAGYVVEVFQERGEELLERSVKHIA